MNIFVLNPGGNSLKADLIRCDAHQRHAFEGHELLSLSVEGIGKEPILSQLEKKKPIAREPIKAGDYTDAAASLFKWYEEHNGHNLPALEDFNAVAIRVVHGGTEFHQPALMDAAVERKIAELEKLAPLHNKSSIEVVGPVRSKLPSTPICGVFDTAFHRTIPDFASNYAIPQELAARHHILRYGFHGISHRYLLERYAYLVGKQPEQCSIVTMHLESGCSVTAIEHGKSVDNSMGLTPLEGLMMGTRSGDIDPSIVPLLMREEAMSVDEVMTLLNKGSGLLAVSGVSLDTRVLMKQYDQNPRAKMAMDMFAYRLRKMVGAHLAALGTADAIVFGGGIGENGGFVRQFVCDGLRSFGVDLDLEANKNLIDAEGRLSSADSKIAAWVIPTEEGLEIAHECCQLMGARQ
ncbi:MAG TPA: acetate/propionate family kinase [Terracidiphilus sp.]|jgi:acetate kinase|nr:acetate/propionate family kinase [Terracidiphilus sp.]